MDYQHHLGTKIISNDGKADYSKPFKKKTSFYMRINPKNSLEYKTMISEQRMHH